MLKNEIKINKIKISKNRQRAFKHRVKQFRLSMHFKTQHLRFIELTKTYNICLIKTEIPRFLKTIYKNHNHYAIVLKLNFLIKRAY